MRSLIFVHGTSVRQKVYDADFAQIEHAIQEYHLPVKLRRCLWGDVLGSKLHAHGASIPDFDRTRRQGTLEQEDADIALWIVLGLDPLYELRVLVLNTNPAEFQDEGVLALDAQVQTLTPSVELTERLNAAGLTDVFEPARQLVIATDVYQHARNAAPDINVFRAALARAIIAQATVLRQEQEQFNDPWAGAGYGVNASLRDALVEQLESDLSAAEIIRGTRFSLPKPVVDLISNLATSYLQQQRGGLMANHVHPFGGDILLYQARGAGIRQFIRQTILEAPAPVVILAHSLGGIASVDLLAQEQFPVELLITVGSQVPFFYEINALTSMAYGEPLPTHFPRWLNIYNRRDFLSFIGAGIFTGRITDVEVESRDPFPAAHGAYWNNPQTWAAIAEYLV